MSSQGTVGPRSSQSTVGSRSGSISRSKPLRTTSSSYITFSPETILFAAANYRQSKEVLVNNNGPSTIMFKMKSTSSNIYRVRPVYFILRPNERRTLNVIFKGLPTEQAVCQRDRLTAVMAFAMSNSNDVKSLWEKHRKISHQPNTSSRKYIKIDFDDERRMSRARAPTTNSAPKTEISRLTSGYPSAPDEPLPPSLPRPSKKVANSGGRDASITHPNSTKKEQAIRAPAVHPSDLRPVKDVPPPLERLEPSLRTSLPLPPPRPIRQLPPSEESKEDEGRTYSSSYQIEDYSCQESSSSCRSNSGRRGGCPSPCLSSSSETQQIQDSSYLSQTSNCISISREVFSGR